MLTTTRLFTMNSHHYRQQPTIVYPVEDSDMDADDSNEAEGTAVSRIHTK